MACSGYNTATNLNNQKCWRYLFVGNTWRVSANTLSTTKPKYPAQSYQNFMYFVSEMLWEALPFRSTYLRPQATTIPPTPVGEGACSVMWGDNMIIFEGVNSSTVTQMFNLHTNHWTALAPMTLPHYSFGCVMLPDRNRVLVVSTVPGGDERRSDLFDASLNTWNVTGSTVYSRAGASLIMLGSIVFAIVGNSAPSPTSQSATVEEYNIKSGTWSLMATNLIGARQHFGVYSLPVTSIAHLVPGCRGV